MTYLFVYGSLKKEIDLPYAKLLRANGELISEGEMNALMYIIDTYPGAILSAELDDWVNGEVYLLKPNSNIITLLDTYEGFSSMFPSQSEFIRKPVPIRLSDGNWLNCWVYLYNRSVINLTRIQHF